MIGTEIQTDYDVRISFQPEDWCDEPHLRVEIDDCGEVATSHLSMRDAQYLMEYIGRWLEWAEKHQDDLAETTIDDEQIPF